MISSSGSSESLRHHAFILAACFLIRQMRLDSIEPYGQQQRIKESFPRPCTKKTTRNGPSLRPVGQLFNFLQLHNWVFVVVELVLARRRSLSDVELPQKSQVSIYIGSDKMSSKITFFAVLSVCEYYLTHLCGAVYILISASSVPQKNNGGFRDGGSFCGLLAVYSGGNGYELLIGFSSSHLARRRTAFPR